MFGPYWLHFLKLNPNLYFHQIELWTPTSFAEMFGSNERLIQFWLSLYPWLLFPQTPFKKRVFNS